MKISEVIQKLEKIKEEHGDVKVIAYDFTSTDGYVESVIYHKGYNAVLIDMICEDDEDCYVLH